MEFLNTVRKLKALSRKDMTVGRSSESFEVVVIEDNKLTNLILSNVLEATIDRIKKIKKCPIKFSSFQFGNDFLSYLENRELGNSKLIVFSDYHLENDITGAEILEKIWQKGIDATVVILSEIKNKQTSIDTIQMGAYCFLPKNNRTPLICSRMLSLMVN